MELHFAGQVRRDRVGCEIVIERDIFLEQDHDVFDGSGGVMWDLAGRRSLEAHTAANRTDSEDLHAEFPSSGYYTALGRRRVTVAVASDKWACPFLAWTAVPAMN